MRRLLPVRLLVGGTIIQRQQRIGNPLHRLLAKGLDAAGPFEFLLRYVTRRLEIECGQIFVQFTLAHIWQVRIVIAGLDVDHIAIQTLVDRFLI